MYFKEKENTNIDSEFESNKKFSLKNFDLKKILLIGGGLVLLIVIIIVIVSITSNSSQYTLELLGEQHVIITLDGDYVEPGYQAYDKNNNDVSTQVEITSNVDYSKPGDYEILYSIQDINKVRYITIVEQTQDTYIYLLGEQTMYLKIGEKYIEPGYNVYDIIDKDLKVIITGNVDTSKKGTYQITYSVTNSRNVTITKTRTVVVE